MPRPPTADGDGCCSIDRAPEVIQVSAFLLCWSRFAPCSRQCLPCATWHAPAGAYLQAGGTRHVATCGHSNTHQHGAAQSSNVESDWYQHIIGYSL
jgi:hypothetical protein